MEKRRLLAASSARRLFASRYAAVAHPVEMLAQVGHPHASATSRVVCQFLARRARVRYGVTCWYILRPGVRREHTYEGGLGQLNPCLPGGSR